MKEDEVYYTYEGFSISFEFVSNGYLLTYKDSSCYTLKKRCFEKFDDLIAFLKSYYSGEWK